MKEKARKEKIQKKGEKRDRKNRAVPATQRRNYIAQFAIT
jgi:hypothetical protein